MGIFNHELEINADDPFKHDKLDRRIEIENLTSLFNVVNNQMVLALNSPWGTGKTSFLKMWEVYLRNKGYNTVFFNCWENDFVGDPFIAFVEEIKRELSHQNKDLITPSYSEKAKEFILQTSRKTRHFLWNTTSDVFGHLTGIDAQTITDDRKGEDNVAKNDISNYNDVKKSLNDFRDELSSIAEKCNEKPLIIFVDELDRCRPNFAIEVLERIKHVFNVENIIFILGIDKEALSNSIKTIYGENTKINGYLSRFIDLEVTLKYEEITDYCYIKYLLENEKYGFEDISINRININFMEFKNICNNILSFFEFPFRELEKLITKLYFILKSYDLDDIDLRILLFMLGLSFSNKEKYNKVASKDISIGETFDGKINYDICYVIGVFGVINNETAESIDLYMTNNNDHIDAIKYYIGRYTSNGEYFKSRFKFILRIIQNFVDYSLISI